MGLSPKPPDPLTPGPVLTPQRGTSRCCWFPCRPPLLVLTGFMAAARIWAALGGGTGLFLTATTILCPSQIGLGTWAGCRSLMKGSFFCHLITAPTLCCYISHLPHRPVVTHFLVNLRKNCECGCEEMNGLMDCPFITVLVYSNFWGFFFHLKFLSKACLWGRAIFIKEWYWFFNVHFALLYKIRRQCPSWCDPASSVTQVQIKWNPEQQRPLLCLIGYCWAMLLKSVHLQCLWKG